MSRNRTPAAPFQRLRVVATVALLLAAVGSGPAAAFASDVSGQWPMGGQNYSGTRDNPAEQAITPANAARLRVAWTATVHGDVSATPAVVDGAAYVPDWGGFLTKFDTETGRTIWAHPVSDYDGIAGSVSRTSPAFYHGTLYIGDQNDATSPLAGGKGAHLMAIDAATGRLRWDSVVDDQFAAFITQSPIVHDGVVYVGISSKEEGMASQPDFPCCTFRGDVVAVSAATGRVLWRTYMIPDNGGRPGGYSGAAIWGGTPVIDQRRHTLYVTTGNNYTVPDSAKKCQQAGGTAQQCLSPADAINSIVALDSRTGRIKWTRGANTFDDWTSACLPQFMHDHCPANNGPDADFGAGPQLFTFRTPGGGRRTLVGAGEKSGIYWMLDADTGKVVWGKPTGPGGLQGGIMWGPATDGKRLYIAQANHDKVSYTLPDGQTIDYGSIAAVDPMNGDILWQIPDPAGGADKGALSVAAGVLYVGSMTGDMYAIDAATGSVLWRFRGQGSSIAGPAIVGGMVLWGNGYGRFDVGTPSTTFYAFAPDGRPSR